MKIEFEMRVPNSRRISAIGLGDQPGTLAVHFRDGRDFFFSDIAPATWSRLGSAKSPATYFEDHVRNRFTEIKPTKVEYLARSIIIEIADSP